jgi:hypothetical protein
LKILYLIEKVTMVVIFSTVTLTPSTTLHWSVRGREIVGTLALRGGRRIFGGVGDRRFI